MYLEKLNLKFRIYYTIKMFGTIYNNIKSVSNWTKEYLLSDNFKRAVFSIVTIGGYHYYFMDKQFRYEREIRKQEEEIRKLEMEIEHTRLINEIKELNKWWFQK